MRVSFPNSSKSLSNFLLSFSSVFFLPFPLLLFLFYIPFVRPKNVINESLSLRFHFCTSFFFPFHPHPFLPSGCSLLTSSHLSSFHYFSLLSLSFLFFFQPHSSSFSSFFLFLYFFEILFHLLLFLLSLKILFNNRIGGKKKKEKKRERRKEK